MAWPMIARHRRVRWARAGRALLFGVCVGAVAPSEFASAADPPAASAPAPALNVPAAGAQRGPTQSLPAASRPELPRLPEAAAPAFAMPSGAPAAGTATGAAPASPPAAAGAQGGAAAIGGGVSAPTAPAPANASAAGITQAVHDLKLSVTAAGRIEALFVKEGDRVRKGDLLLHMDRTLEALEVRRREVMLEDNARLDELRAKELTLAEQVRSARTLLTTGGVSRKQVEDEELTLGAIAAERKSIEFAKRRERVELDLAREAYERRHLRSPIDGMVTRIVSRIGESVAPHEPVMVVVDVRTVRFSGTVPIAEVSRVRAGSSVVLQLGPDAEPLKRLAYVVFVSPVADPASGLVDVIAEFDNADGSIRPGTAGRILGTSATSALPPAGANRGRR
jgi:membrane fusion protein, multidrug efflux system